MQHAEKEVRWPVVATYLASVGLAALFSKAFYVLSTAQLVLIVCLLIAPIGIASMYRKPQIWFGCGHVFAAIALHPAVWLDMEKAQATHAQIQGVYMLNRPSGHDWHVLANAALDLTHAIQTDMLLRMKLRAPLMFWLYPLSVVLLAWGVYAFFRPETRRAG